MKPVEEELELERLLANEDAGLGASVSVLRERGPDATELASLASRLALQGIDVTPQPAQAPHGAWKKWALGGAGGLSAVLLWAGLRAPAPVVLRAQANPVAVQVAHSAQVEGGQPLLRPLAGAAKSADAVAGTAPVMDPRASDSDLVESPVSSAPAAIPPSSPQPSDSAVPSVSASTPGVRSTSASALTPGRSQNNIPPSPSAAEAPSEIELLRDARWALRQAPTRALELADQHARLYPQGKLTQERELLAITALVALGRRTAALSRGASFGRAFPASPYQKQIGELLR